MLAAVHLLISMKSIVTKRSAFVRYGLAR